MSSAFAVQALKLLRDDCCGQPKKWRFFGLTVEACQAGFECCLTRHLSLNAASFLSGQRILPRLMVKPRKPHSLLETMAASAFFLRRLQGVE